MDFEILGASKVGAFLAVSLGMRADAEAYNFRTYVAPGNFGAANPSPTCGRCAFVLTRPSVIEGPCSSPCLIAALGSNAQLGARY